MQLGILTPGQVEFGEGVVRITGHTYRDDRAAATGTIEFDAAQLAATVETITIADQVRMGPCWGEALHRIVFTLSRPSTEGTLVYRIGR